jgi:hypothetical protein
MALPYTEFCGSCGLILCFNAGEQLQEESLPPELAAEECGTMARLVVRGSAEIGARAEQSPLIVVGCRLPTAQTSQSDS